jgi:hypothetical protein
MPAALKTLVRSTREKFSGSFCLAESARLDTTKNCFLSLPPRLALPSSRQFFLTKLDIRLLDPIPRISFFPAIGTFLKRHVPKGLAMKTFANAPATISGSAAERPFATRQVRSSHQKNSTIAVEYALLAISVGCLLVRGASCLGASLSCTLMTMAGLL